VADRPREPPARFPLHPSAQDILAAVLVGANRAGPEGVVAFDLDSTLLDNRPRQAAIVREFAGREGLEALAAFDARHLVTGFDLREALGRAGLDAEMVARWMPAFRAHWLERFFTSDACLEDIPIAGAPEYTARVHATGVQLVYLTARPERMRPGTLEVLGRFGFPLPSGSVQLWMKPEDTSVNDEDFKRSTHHALSGVGQLVAAFDNEPGHANDFRATFPGAMVVLLATGHSGRVGVLAEGIAVIPDLQFSGR
jgi:hypothetical protein